MATFKIAAFTCNTSGARQNITPSGGPGTNPKAAIFVVSGATALDTSTAHGRVSIGMTDGTTQLVNSLAQEDGITVATADTGNRFDNTMVISTCNVTSGSTAEAIDSEANFVAWTNDGVAINWVDFPATALRGHVIFFYGSDLSADVVSVTPSATQDSASTVTGIPFAPDTLIGVSSWNAYSDGGSGAQARISIGFASNYGGSIQQACRSHIDADRAIQTASIHRTNRFLSRVGTASESANYEVTAFTSDGFTITTRTGSFGSPCAVLALKVNNARSRVVSTIVDTNATGQKFVDSFMFKPKMAFFLGGEATASNTYSTAQNGGAFFGAAVSATEEFSTAWLDENIGVSTSNADTYSMSTSSAPIRLPNVTGGTLLVADLTGFVHNGININVTTASVNDHVMSFLAFEDETARIGADTEQIADEGIFRVTIDRRALPDTERIADEFLFRTTDRKAFDDTERISDDFRLVVTSDVRVLSDTEAIADAVLFVRTSDRRISGDTERITDAFNFIVGKHLVANDTVRISDQFVLVQSGALTLISSDTERISDSFVMLTGAVTGLTLVANDTVRISDEVVRITGRVLISGDTEAISDSFSFGRGLIARKSIRRGRVF